MDEFGTFANQAQDTDRSGDRSGSMVLVESPSLSFHHDRRRLGGPLTPRDRAFEICREVIWWHNQFGSLVTLEDVMGDRRFKAVVQVRGDCMRRLHGAVGWSLPQLGKFFKRDHTTCLHHIQKKGVVNEHHHPFNDEIRMDSIASEITRRVTKERYREKLRLKGAKQNEPNQDIKQPVQQ